MGAVIGPLLLPGAMPATGISGYSGETHTARNINSFCRELWDQTSGVLLKLRRHILWVSSLK